MGSPQPGLAAAGLGLWCSPAAWKGWCPELSGISQLSRGFQLPPFCSGGGKEQHRPLLSPLSQLPQGTSPAHSPEPTGVTGRVLPCLLGGDRAGTRPRLAQQPPTPSAAPRVNLLSPPEMCDENSPEWRWDSQVWSGVHVLINSAGEGAGQAEELCFPVPFLFSFPGANREQLHLIFSFQPTGLGRAENDITKCNSVAKAGIFLIDAVSHGHSSQSWN